ncbi:MAG: polysaccharide biosynthesis C-terminal domain-containing protein [Faecousia sp.]
MENKNTKKQNFLTGAAILSLSTIVVKVIGMLYKLPLNQIIDSQGFAYFNKAYAIYTVLLVISTTGLPVAMSRMVSEAQAQGNGKQMQRIFRTAMIAYLSIGFLGTAVMMLFPHWLATDVMSMPNAWYSIFALGPAVLCICIASACRGYFQGQGDMTPTAVSQIIEALGKLLLGLGFAWIVMRLTDDVALASGASIAGISIGAACSALYVFLRYRRNRKKVAALGGEALSYGATAKKLLAIAVPITLGAAGLQLINLIDEIMVTRRLLEAAGATPDGAQTWMGQMLELARSGMVAELPEGAVLQWKDVMQTAVENQSGVYALCQTIFNFPTAFFPCITAAIIPAITAHLTRGDQKNVRLVQESSLRLTGLIAWPCMVGLLTLSEPIMALLGGYGDSRVQLAAVLLAILAPTVLLNGITTVTTAIMQAHNRPWLPMVNMLIGGIVKVIVNYILVGNPSIGILGAPVGTMACFLVYMILNIFTMRHVLEEPPKLLPRLWKSGIAAIVMGIVAYGSYRGLTMFLSSVVVCCLGAIVAAVIVYVLMVILLKVITYDDCMLLPKGEKIAKLLKIH